MKCKWISAFLSMVLLFIIMDAEADELVRSSSLKEIVTQKENIVRVDFVNEQGSITYAADLGYATAIITKSDHSEMEEYFDADGKPAKQSLGHYAIYREYDEKGRNWRTTFLGLDKRPIITGNGYSGFIRAFYENGNVKTEHYFDVQGNPVDTVIYGYGYFKEYDENNRSIMLTYLGNDEKPVVTGQGFAIVRSIFCKDEDETGHVEEFYYNSNNEPAILLYGQSGLYKKLDQYGRPIMLTYLDIKGNPIITNAGYTTIKRTYYEDDTVETEMYFDIQGEPVKLSEGQYGIRYEDENIVYLDKNGQEQINLKQFLYNNEWAVILAAVGIIIISLSVGRSINGLLMIFYMLVIVYMTLMNRNKVASEHYDILLSVYGDQFTDNIISAGVLNNILLFLPLGTILYRLQPRMNILIVPIFISILIELTQYFFKMGLFELSDIVSNGFGSFLGYAIGSSLKKLLKNSGNK